MGKEGCFRPSLNPMDVSKDSCPDTDSGAAVGQRAAGVGGGPEALPGPPRAVGELEVVRERGRDEHGR